MRVNHMKGYPTPQSLGEINTYIDGLPTKAEKEAAIKAVGMTWNFLAEMNKQFQEFGGDSFEHLY
jgi:hypothetical protein